MKAIDILKSKMACMGGLDGDDQQAAKKIFEIKKSTIEAWRNNRKRPFTEDRLDRLCNPLMPYMTGDNGPDERTSWVVPTLQDAEAKQEASRILWRCWRILCRIGASNERKSVVTKLARMMPPLYAAYNPREAPNAGIVQRLLKDFPDALRAFTRCESKRGGIIIYGPTGAGKTFAEGQVLAKIATERGMPYFEALGVTALKTLATNAARGNDDAQTSVEALKAADILMIDDLHQAKLSTGFAQTLFDVIENAVSRRKVLILTAQVTGAGLARKWCSDDPNAKDTAQAIVRRLRDYCVAVEMPKTGFDERA